MRVLTSFVGGLGCAALVGCLIAPVAAHAADAGRGQAIANANACMGCHAVDRKLVGPSFRQIAERYKGDPAAAAKLVKKVKDGGAGVWGMIPMPAHQGMSDADVKAVVEWVLAGAPGGGK